MQGPHDTRRGPGREDDRSASHVVIERPGLSHRAVAVLTVLACVIGLAVVVRSAGSDDASAPDAPAPSTSTTITTATRPAPAPTGPERERSLVPAELPCPPRPGSTDDAPADPATAPVTGALIPGSTSVLSWTDPGLSAAVVPGTDVVVLSSAGGAEEHRRVGRVDPRTGTWTALFDQDGCTVRAALAVGAGGGSAPGLWVLLAAGDGAYVADLALDGGRVRWAARADGATRLVDAGDHVWVISDAFRSSRRQVWAGQTDLVAVDTRSHHVAAPIRIRAAIIPADPGELVVVQNERVARLDPTTGEVTDRLGTIDGLFAGEPFTDRAVVADGWLWTIDGYGATARLTRRDLDTFVADPPRDAPCGQLLPRRTAADGRSTVAVVHGCGTEVTLQSFDPETGSGSELARFTTYVRYEFDRPVPVVPALVAGTSGYWYVNRFPTPSSPRGGAPSDDTRWHLFHVGAPEPVAGLPRG